MSIISRLGLIFFLLAMFALTTAPKLKDAETATLFAFFTIGIILFVFGGNDKCKCK